MGRSIVVYDTGDQPLGCACITPALVADEEIEISFPRNGTNPKDIDRYVLHFLRNVCLQCMCCMVTVVGCICVSGSILHTEMSRSRRPTGHLSSAKV